jgi:hypothetical protein
MLRQKVIENQKITVVTLEKEVIRFKDSDTVLDKIYFTWGADMCEAYPISGIIKDVGEAMVDVTISTKENSALLKTKVSPVKKR